MENGILAKQAASGGRFDQENTDLDDIESLKQQIVKYKGLLKSAVQKSAIVLDVDGNVACAYGNESIGVILATVQAG